MASFKLFLLALGDKQYEGNIVEYLPSMISEFYSQQNEYDSRTDANTILNTSVSFCYTYNEQLSIHTNSQKDLSFSMDRMVLVNNEWIENPYAQHIQIGSQLLLEDKYQNQYLFTVTKIAYTFKLNNITYNITCQDTFNYQLTRQNDGYEIQNTSTESDFIGAKDVDWWTEKIVNECHLSYQYIPLEQSLFLSQQGPYQVVLGQNYNNLLKKLIKQPFSRKIEEDKELFETIPFSGSGNAASILINLGEQLGLILKTFEHFQYNDKGEITNQLIRYFWFEPAKNNIVSGLQYSPFDSVQQFSLTHTGDALTTVLNVSGPTYEDELITLLPDISPFFIRLFQNPQWTRSTYYANMYSDLINQKVYHYDRYSGGDFEIANVENNELNTTIEVLSELGTEAPTKAFYYSDNIYIPINDIGVETFFIPDLYDQVDFYTNNQQSWITVKTAGSSQPIGFYSKDTDWCFSQWTESINEGVTSYSLQVLNPNQFGKDLSNVYITITHTKLNWIADGHWDDLDLYIRCSRTPTVEDETFATIANQIPWLENKLIDFSYFTDHNLLNHYQYSNIMKTINNDLRIVNGQLIWYTQEYYSALHKKTEALADIQNMIDSLSANFNYSVVESYLTSAQIYDIDNFVKAYNLVVQAWHPTEKTEILNYSETISDYLNKYFKAQQRFYKNIKLFRDYFEAPVSFLSQNSGVYKYELTLIESAATDSTPTVGTKTSYVYTFDEGSLTQTLDSTFNDYDQDPNSPTYGEVFTPIVNAKDLSTIDIVTASNYTQYDYAAKLGGKDFYYQDSDQQYNIQTKYYLPEYKVEITGTGSGQYAMQAGLVIGYLDDSTLPIALSVYTYNLIEKKKVGNRDYYTYECIVRPDPATLEYYENNHLNDEDSWMQLNFNPSSGTGWNWKIISKNLVYSVAQKSDMIWNYVKRNSDALPSIYIHNKDTYVAIGTGSSDSYINLDLASSPFYTQFIWQETDKIETNKWTADSNGYTTYTSTYLANMPINELYLRSPRYQFESTWNVYNNQGYSLYQFLRDQTIHGKNATLVSPFDSTDGYGYLSLPVANKLNYETYYHYINKSQVAHAVSNGLATVAITHWWNYPIASILTLGACIAWICAAVQDSEWAATLGNSGVGRYSIPRPDHDLDNPTKDKYTKGWTSDFYSQANGIFYIPAVNSLDLYNEYHNLTLDALSFDWSNNLMLPFKEVNNVKITPAMYEDITKIDVEEYNELAASGSSTLSLLQFTTDKQTSYWKLTSPSGRTYWDFYSYFVPTAYELFINHGGNFDYKPLTNLYIKDKYYRWIPPRSEDGMNYTPIDRNHKYVLVPLLKADYIDYAEGKGIYNNDYLNYNSYTTVESLPYCLLQEFASDAISFIDTDGTFKQDIFMRLYGANKLIDKFHQYDHLHDNTWLISRIIHYPLAKYAIPLDTHNLPVGVTNTVDDLLNLNKLGINLTRTAGKDCWVYSTEPDINDKSYFQSLFIILQEVDYDLQNVDSTYINQHLVTPYYTDNDLSFDWTKQSAFVQGLYIPVKYDEVREYTDGVPFDMNTRYYNKNGQRIYTIEQLKRGDVDDLLPATLKTSIHTEINLNNTKTEFTLPVLETTRTITYSPRLIQEIKTYSSLPADITIGAKYDYTDPQTNKVISTTIKSIIYNSPLACTLTLVADQDQTGWSPIITNVSTNTQRLIVTFKPKNLVGTEDQMLINNHGVKFKATITSILDSDSLKAANNGTFWYHYHSSDTYPILFELAAAIETQLQVYWSQAYNASLYCDYFLPRAWQFYIENQPNAFSGHLFLQDNEKIYLNTKFVPIIDVVRNNSESIKLPNYQFKYLKNIVPSDFNKHNYCALNSLSLDIGIQECFENNNLSMANWYAEDMGSTTNYYKLINGGTKWSELIDQGLQVSTLAFNEYSGIYPLMVKYLANAYMERSTYCYDTLKSQHDTIWQTLYNRYPSVILEGNYKNEDATTSSDLLTVARNEFRDKSYPERGYTITVIDNISLLKGYEGQELKIGDSIALRANEFYNGFDDIKNSLSQYLFITDIKYTLRKDTDISLTVNSIKYKDKMLQRLVKLIK